MKLLLIHIVSLMISLFIAILSFSVADESDDKKIKKAFFYSIALTSMLIVALIVFSLIGVVIGGAPE